MYLQELKGRKSISVILGIGFGLLLFFSPGSLFILFFSVLIVIFFMDYIPDKSERRFILTLFLSGLGARIILTLLIMFFCIVRGNILNYTSLGCPNYSTPYIIDDSGYYTLRSLFTSMYWMNIPLNPLTLNYIVENPYGYGYSGFNYILASFFTLFGYSPISSRFINCILGTLTIILVYSIVKNIFGEKPARLSAVMTAFLPSIFLWSTTNLKDTSLIFLVYIMLWSLVKFQKTKNIYYLFITVLSTLSQVFIRSHNKDFFYLSIAILLFYFLYLIISNLLFTKKIVMLFTIFMISSFLIFSKSNDKVKSTIDSMVQRVYIYHKGVISEGGICYKLLSDEYYTTSKNINYSDFFKMLGKGWLHVIFEPFPWKIQSKAMLFSFPQMVLWYFLIPFAILGAAISLRYRLRESIILVIYFLIMTSALALIGGNIGTIFRFRDVITPILLIFSSVGLISTFNSLNLKIVDVKVLYENGLKNFPCWLKILI